MESHRMFREDIVAPLFPFLTVLVPHLNLIDFRKNSLLKKCVRVILIGALLG